MALDWHIELAMARRYEHKLTGYSAVQWCQWEQVSVQFWLDLSSRFWLTDSGKLFQARGLLIANAEFPNFRQDRTNTKSVLRGRSQTLPSWKLNMEVEGVIIHRTTTIVRILERVWINWTSTCVDSYCIVLLTRLAILFHKTDGLTISHWLDRTTPSSITRNSGSGILRQNNNVWPLQWRSQCCDWGIGGHSVLLG